MCAKRSLHGYEFQNHSDQEVPTSSAVRFSGRNDNNKMIILKTSICTCKNRLWIQIKNRKNHHSGVWNIKNIPGIDIIDFFPLDYMHLIFLGVIKKLLLNLWHGGKPYTKILNISYSLIHLAKIYSNKM